MRRGTPPHCAIQTMLADITFASTSTNSNPATLLLPPQQITTPTHSSTHTTLTPLQDG